MSTGRKFHSEQSIIIHYKVYYSESNKNNQSEAKIRKCSKILDVMMLQLMCNEPLSREDSFVTPTGLLLQSS
ncbi:hypothetical protein T07_9500 [Trichinella nelsoni]|uniref:Uncharacterized protein n=1 Tax=Trichinella nelsoni TaxID=6336 RepID=A0A0V0RH68_9BILA|nr:hypothetical protein T07_9500 [Trichinella nelsoni]